LTGAGFRGEDEKMFSKSIKSHEMKNFNYLDELDANVIVCDTTGVIIYMNKTAIRNYDKDGGDKLIGQNLLDCHPEPARSKCVELLETQTSNVYTIEKRGIKKMIIQKPWFENGVFGGLIEIGLQIPFTMEHFVRQS
jgi:transcriptional regulator with PAS, ATPase and Fis domain